MAGGEAALEPVLSTLPVRRAPRRLRGRAAQLFLPDPPTFGSHPPSEADLSLAPTTLKYAHFVLFNGSLHRKTSRFRSFVGCPSRYNLDLVPFLMAKSSKRRRITRGRERAMRSDGGWVPRGPSFLVRRRTSKNDDELHRSDEGKKKNTRKIELSLFPL